VKEPNMFHN